ncbi:hypothetical protein ACLIBG_10815 [Virgibacillus sp. W0181]|uniref:hypothetical protein n=1 Tax=Virgibacillus sp. W0181 TaxID=3391581 RepID=UPI003F45FF05
MNNNTEIGFHLTFIVLMYFLVMLFCMFSSIKETLNDGRDLYMDHFLSIEEFNDQLSKWNGKRVKVSKLEMDDVDETVLALEYISYEKDTRRLDDYESMYTLELNGAGMTQTDNERNELQPLPSSLYEIPLENNTLYEFDESEFIISTDRAVYKIVLA